MMKIVLDSALLAQLQGAGESAEICDESGCLIGYFTPAVDSSHYQEVEVPISEEELEDREQNLTGRTLREIMDDLENQQ